MNIKLFKSKMVLNGDTNESLARAIGISPQRCCAKINSTNGAEFTQGQIAKIKVRWKLSAQDIDDIFFADKVS